MSVNQYLPHIFVLPEDDANRQIANGFHQKVTRERQMQVLRPAGGWARVLSLFESEHVAAMDRCPNRFMVLLIDSDNDETRLAKAKATIPAHLAERVFILGAWSEPERLKTNLGNFEIIGSKVAEDCRSDTDLTLRHELLRHNAPELARLRQHVLPILFPSA
jgi:hypothetical protein